MKALAILILSTLIWASPTLAAAPLDIKEETQNALLKRNCDVVVKNIKANPDLITSSFVLSAVQFGNEEIFKIIYAHDPNLFSVRSELDDNLLHLAWLNGDLGMLDFLAQKMPPEALRQKNRANFTPAQQFLMNQDPLSAFIIGHHHPEILDDLYSAGNNITILDAIRNALYYSPDQQQRMVELVQTRHMQLNEKMRKSFEGSLPMWDASNFAPSPRSDPTQAESGALGELTQALRDLNMPGETPSSPARIFYIRYYVGQLARHERGNADLASPNWNSKNLLSLIDVYLKTMADYSLVAPYSPHFADKYSTFIARLLAEQAARNPALLDKNGNVIDLIVSHLMRSTKQDAQSSRSVALQGLMTKLGAEPEFSSAVTEALQLSTMDNGNEIIAQRASTFFHKSLE